MNENEKLEMNESENPITEDFVENPFSFEKDESAGDYPLTLEELKAVAARLVGAIHRYWGLLLDV